MITVKNFEVLSHLVNPPQEGEYAVCTETSQVFQFKDGQWNKVEKPDAKLNVNLYELNKTLYKSLPTINFNELQKKKMEIETWIHLCNNKYFMLLNREKADYTLFAITGTGAAITKELVDLINERANAIKSIEIDNEEMWIQFWIEKDHEIYMYAFFPYDNGVIECQE